MIHDELIEDLVSQFEAKDFRYRINDELVVPTKDDLSRILADMKSLLGPEPDGAQISVGRLIMKKADGHHDVYLFIGEYNE
jgi:hypothetical protein